MTIGQCFSMVYFCLYCGKNGGMDADRFCRTVSCRWFRIDSFETAVNEKFYVINLKKRLTKMTESTTLLQASKQASKQGITASFIDYSNNKNAVR
jgi:hypothetical protein